MKLLYTDFYHKRNPDFIYTLFNRELPYPTITWEENGKKGSTSHYSKEEVEELFNTAEWIKISNVYRELTPQEIEEEMRKQEDKLCKHGNKDMEVVSFYGYICCKVGFEELCEKVIGANLSEFEEGDQ